MVDNIPLLHGKKSSSLAPISHLSHSWKWHHHTPICSKQGGGGVLLVTLESSSSPTLQSISQSVSKPFKTTLKSIHLNSKALLSYWPKLPPPPPLLPPLLPLLNHRLSEMCTRYSLSTSKFSGGAKNINKIQTLTMAYRPLLASADLTSLLWWNPHWPLLSYDTSSSYIKAFVLSNSLHDVSFQKCHLAGSFLLVVQLAAYMHYLLIRISAFERG